MMTAARVARSGIAVPIYDAESGETFWLEFGPNAAQDSRIRAQKTRDNSGRSSDFKEWVIAEKDVKLELEKVRGIPQLAISLVTSKDGKSLSESSLSRGLGTSYASAVDRGTCPWLKSREEAKAEDTEKKEQNKQEDSLSSSTAGDHEARTAKRSRLQEEPDTKTDQEEGAVANQKSSYAVGNIAQATHRLFNRFYPANTEATLSTRAGNGLNTRPGSASSTSDVHMSDATTERADAENRHPRTLTLRIIRDEELTYAHQSGPLPLWGHWTASPKVDKKSGLPILNTFQAMKECSNICGPEYSKVFVYLRWWRTFLLPGSERHELVNKVEPATDFVKQEKNFLSRFPGEQADRGWQSLGPADCHLVGTSAEYWRAMLDASGGDPEKASLRGFYRGIFGGPTLHAETEQDHRGDNEQDPFANLRIAALVYRPMREILDAVGYGRRLYKYLLMVSSPSRRNHRDNAGSSAEEHSWWMCSNAWKRRKQREFFESGMEREVESDFDNRVPKDPRYVSARGQGVGGARLETWGTGKDFLTEWSMIYDSCQAMVAVFTQCSDVTSVSLGSVTVAGCSIDANGAVAVSPDMKLSEARSREAPVWYGLEKMVYSNTNGSGGLVRTISNLSGTLASPLAGPRSSVLAPAKGSTAVGSSSSVADLSTAASSSTLSLADAGSAAEAEAQQQLPTRTASFVSATAGVSSSSAGAGEVRESVVAGAAPLGGEGGTSSSTSSKLDVAHPAPSSPMPGMAASSSRRPVFTEVQRRRKNVYWSNLLPEMAFFLDNLLTDHKNTTNKDLEAHTHFRCMRSVTELFLHIFNAFLHNYREAVSILTEEAGGAADVSALALGQTNASSASVTASSEQDPALPPRVRDPHKDPGAAATSPTSSSPGGSSTSTPLPRGLIATATVEQLDLAFAAGLDDVKLQQSRDFFSIAKTLLYVSGTDEAWVRARQCFLKALCRRGISTYLQEFSEVENYADTLCEIDDLCDLTSKMPPPFQNDPAAKKREETQRESAKRAKQEKVYNTFHSQWMGLDFAAIMAVLDVDAFGIITTSWKEELYHRMFERLISCKGPRAALCQETFQNYAVCIEQKAAELVTLLDLHAMSSKAFARHTSLEVTPQGRLMNVAFYFVRMLRREFGNLILPRDPATAATRQGANGTARPASDGALTPRATTPVNNQAAERTPGGGGAERDLGLGADDAAMDDDPWATT
ncbi:unnamed protein product [Amoebophrya sp. A25]|nr:unnamed protein product [Amoebophrya sp. A25]|eukprot:GSA25T00025130001.1